jgi:hypothetical protein
MCPTIQQTVIDFLGVVASIFKPSTQETETGGSSIWSKPRIVDCVSKNKSKSQTKEKLWLFSRFNCDYLELVDTLILQKILNNDCLIVWVVKFWVTEGDAISVVWNKDEKMSTIVIHLALKQKQTAQCLPDWWK